MRYFLEAYEYFYKIFKDEKLAKDLAEKATGEKAPQGKINIPEKRAPKKFVTPQAAKDVIAASDEVSPSYAKGDTKYNADILAEEIARKRGFIKEGQDSDDMDVKAYSEIYSEAYKFLTDLNRLNKATKQLDEPQVLLTKKDRGSLLTITSKFSNPMKSDFIMSGLDGTTESLYVSLRREKEMFRGNLEKDLNYAKYKNLAIGKSDIDNIIHNIKIYKSISKKVDELSDQLIDQGKDPEKVFDTMLISRSTPKSIVDKMNESTDKIKKLLKEMEDLSSGKTEKDRKALAKMEFTGKGYGENSPIFRGLVRPFLKDEAESGRIELSPEVYNAMKTGGHPFIDPIKIFRHHYGDDAFDKVGKYIDDNFNFDQGIRYPGRFEFRKADIVPKNKKAPGKTYDHYSLPAELDVKISQIDSLISDIEKGNVSLYRDKDEIVRGIMEQNTKRAELVKVRNELAPEDTKILPGDEVLESADIFEFPDDTNFAEGGIVSI